MPDSPESIAERLARLSAEASKCPRCQAVIVEAGGKDLAPGAAVGVAAVVLRAPQATHRDRRVEPATDDALERSF